MTENRIPFVAEGFTDQVDSLLGAGHHHQVVKLPQGVAAGVHPGFEGLPQGRVPFGEGVLQNPHRVLPQHLGGDLGDGLHWEGVGGRVPGGESDDARVGGKL